MTIKWICEESGVHRTEDRRFEVQEIVARGTGLTAWRAVDTLGDVKFGEERLLRDAKLEVEKVINDRQRTDLDGTQTLMAALFKNYVAEYKRSWPANRRLMRERVRLNPLLQEGSLPGTTDTPLVSLLAVFDRIDARP